MPKGLSTLVQSSCLAQRGAGDLPRSPLPYFTYIFNVKGEISNSWYLISVYTHIFVPRPDEDATLGSKLAAL
jgi:hypothetical protein